LTSPKIFIGRTYPFIGESTLFVLSFNFLDGYLIVSVAKADLKMTVPIESSSEEGDFMSTLIANGQLIGASSTESEGPSPCQLNCETEQTELKSCLDRIRSTQDNSCLSNCVAAWTKCCSEANESVQNG